MFNKRPPPRLLRCPRCKRVYPDGSACPACGVPLEDAAAFRARGSLPKACPACGAEASFTLEREASFRESPAELAHDMALHQLLLRNPISPALLRRFTQPDPRMFTFRCAACGHIIQKVR